MQKVKLSTLAARISLPLLALLLTFSINSTAQEATVIDTAAGEALFKANCAACHKLYKKAVGPALYQVGDKYERDWLYRWVRNSQELVQAGDAQAVAIFN